MTNADKYQTRQEGDQYFVTQGDLVLDTCATQEEAKKSVWAWKTRDQLEADIEQFVDEMLEKYHGDLPDDEIRKMIKEY